MKKLIVILSLIVGLTNCQIVDVLDQDPMYKLDLEGAITNPDMAELALVGTYRYLPGGNSGLDYTFTVLSGSFLSGSMLRQKFVTPANINAIYYPERTLPTLSNSDFGGEWDSDYRMIKNANFLLEALKGINENDFATGRKSEMIGECHFLIAFGYYRLIRQFAEYWDMNSTYGLVLRSELPSVANAPKARATVAESYAEIEAHLTIALNQLKTYETSTKASLEAAKALKAEVLFLKGDYANAAIAAADAISSVNPLEGNYADVFEKAGSSKEIIFARGLNTTENSSAANYMDQAFGTKGLWGPTDTYMEVIKGDPRKDWVVWNKDVVYTDRSGNTGTYNVNTVRKLYQADKAVPVLYTRTAELYLIQGESLARSGASIADAWVPVVEVRKRAGADVTTPATQEALMEAIYNEWLIEMSFENWHEWFAVQRFGKLFDLNATVAESLKKEEESENGDPEAYKQRLQWRRICNIPTSETNANPLCEMNPGY